MSLQRWHRVEWTRNTCSELVGSLVSFSFFAFLSGGLIQLNHGRPQPLQYVVNAAFLATVFSDYLDAADTPGWYCGPNFYSTDVLRDFARTQVCHSLLSCFLETFWYYLFFLIAY